jgi:DNA polymerase III alpha subunit
MQDGLGSIEQFISRVQELKMKSVSITVLDGMYGAVEFYKKSISAGI